MSYFQKWRVRAQAASGTVQRDQSYVWDFTQCAADESTLDSSLQAMDIGFTAAGQPGSNGRRKLETQLIVPNK